MSVSHAKSSFLLIVLMNANFMIGILQIDFWKFEWKFKMIEIFFYEFVKKMTSIAHVFSIQTVYRFCLDDDEADFWNDDNDISDNLINVSKKLCQKYHDFFNIWKADQLAFY